MKPFITSILFISLSASSLAQPGDGNTKNHFGQSFIPDYTFKGSGLKGLKVVGQADWQVKSGELMGKAKPGTSGGWLFLDSSYQDVGFRALFKGTGDVETGILFRAEKTAEGVTGILLSLKKGDIT
ncbi:MAG: hypothetical protein WKF89_10445, partial [Chitinophagaceae bacterium]